MSKHDSKLSAFELVHNMARPQYGTATIWHGHNKLNHGQHYANTYRASVLKGIGVSGWRPNSTPVVRQTGAQTNDHADTHTEPGGDT